MMWTTLVSSVVFLIFFVVGWRRTTQREDSTSGSGRKARAHVSHSLVFTRFRSFSLVFHSFSSVFTRFHSFSLVVCFSSEHKSKEVKLPLPKKVLLLPKPTIENEACFTLVSSVVSKVFLPNKITEAELPSVNLQAALRCLFTRFERSLSSLVLSVVYLHSFRV